jgi:tRNA pseudouridine13 synthase
MKQYAYTHQPIYFDFKQTIERFFVEEIPLFRFTGNGNYLILKIKKSDMSTWKLINVLTKATGAREHDIGYGGLKDKSATTIQYLSLPKQFERELVNLTTEKIEILEKTYHKSPIKIGQLKGNRFIIKLYGVTDDAAKMIEIAGLEMVQGGIPNYFGYQRFGEDKLSYLQGKEIAQSGKKLKGSKEKLLVAAYQSHLFNSWLGERVKISHTIATEPAQKAAKSLFYPIELVKVLAAQPQFFKLFLGDMMMSYPSGSLSYLRDMAADAKQFSEHKISPTGLLCGSHTMRSQSDAYHLESPYDDEELSALRGDRRFAWIWPEHFSTRYEPTSRTMELCFTLPKGAYATTFLEEISKKDLQPPSAR